MPLLCGTGARSLGAVAFRDLRPARLWCSRLAALLDGCYPHRPNGCLVNWYGPSHHIGPHRDDTRQLVPVRLWAVSGAFLSRHVLQLAATKL